MPIIVELGAFVRDVRGLVNWGQARAGAQLLSSSA